MGKLRFSEVRLLAQAHTASERQTEPRRTQQTDISSWEMPQDSSPDCCNVVGVPAVEKPNNIPRLARTLQFTASLIKGPASLGL